MHKIKDLVWFGIRVGLFVSEASTIDLPESRCIDGAELRLKLAQ